MNSDDARRQTATVNRLLKAFTAEPDDRRELQLLADEVGLGKTFVALATGYTLMNFVRTKRDLAAQAGLGQCGGAMIVVVPSSLTKKWAREVEALRTRCSTDPRRTDWFRGRICDDVYDLADGVRRASDLRRSPAKNPCVLICSSGIFGKRVAQRGWSLRFLAACLFRWWGNRLSMHERFRIVSRAAEVPEFADWASSARRKSGGYEVDLWNFASHEEYLTASESERADWPREAQVICDATPFVYEDVRRALDAFNRTEAGRRLLENDATELRDGHEEQVGLLPFCKDAAQRRGHADWYFRGFQLRLADLYKKLARHLIERDVPLVVVDEAHHWRNAQRQDCKLFGEHLAPLTRRMLLLTATPFQLHSDELLNVLAAGDKMEAAIGADRVQRLQALRRSIAAAAEASAAAGRSFSREWGLLPEAFAKVDWRFDPAAGEPPRDVDPRTLELARHWNRLSVSEAPAAVDRHAVPRPLQPFFHQALRLAASHVGLRGAMHALIVRHRRPIGHRRVLAGREYPPTTETPTRPDEHVLHSAPGSVLPPNAELAQYLLMKVVAGASTGNHRTALGTDLTGCYTTLWQSQEGRKAIEAAGCSPALSKVLQTATGFNGDAPNRLDRDHPKLRQVVAETMRRWDHGEKTLIFCFRVPTAETLHRILNEQVEQRLRVARRELFKTRGTEVGDEAEADRAMQQFRRSFTARDSSGVSLFLDRVLLGWLQLHDLPSPELRESDRLALATLYARARIGGRPLLQDRNPRLDRVFLNRVLEHVWAGRLLTDGTAWRKGLSKTACEDGERLLRAIANERWVRFRYGLDERADIVPDWDGDADSIQATSHAAAAAQYELVDEVSSDAVRRIAELLRVGDRGSRHDWLGSGPNLFTPLGLERTALRADATGRIDEMRRLLFSIAAPTERGRWQERAKVLDAVTRALLRDDVLLRMPKSVFKDDDTTWAMSLLRGLHEPPKGGGREPLAERLKLFLTELAAMGPKERDAHLSYATNARASAVALVTGSAGSADRESIFNGFNTPMLPDVLVCTSVGQEGIDLHRHCRHVVHYDLGWNPATLEQRTGRTDRLGSLALRERANAIAERLSSSEHPRDSSPSESRLPSLDVALPYLAGTYDERMYEVLRSRAQTFDILTGGDPAAQRAADSTWLEPDDPGAPGDASFVPLPPEMLERLRVNLAVADD